MKRQSFLQMVFNPWVFIGALLVGGVLFSLALGVLIFGRPEPKPLQPATAVLLVIQAATSTPVPKTPTLSPTELTPPPQDGGQGEPLAVGRIIRVSGTGGEGLRVREKAGLDAMILFLASDGETFEIKEGPQKQDGYEWWYLVDTNDQGRRGWAVSNFIRVIPGS